MTEPHRVFHPHLKHTVLQKLGLRLTGNLGTHNLLPTKERQGDFYILLPVTFAEKLLENSADMFRTFFLQWLIPLRLSYFTVFCVLTVLPFSRHGHASDMAIMTKEASEYGVPLLRRALGVAAVCGPATAMSIYWRIYRWDGTHNARTGVFDQSSSEWRISSKSSSL